MKNNQKTKIIILAGGKSTRMKSEMPKVLLPLRGKSMIKHLLESVHKTGIDDSPVIVVGYRYESVKAELGEKYHFVLQEPQLGTGHAVGTTRKHLENKADHVIVLYGDMPFLKPETIKKLNEKHTESGAKITMATVNLPNFEDWRICFANFGRITRDSTGKILGIIEKKDASIEELKITEVNPSYFCIDTSWLWDKIENLDSNNANNEYYLTDIIKIAVKDGARIESISIEPHEALGANTKEEMDILEKFIV